LRQQANYLDRGQFKNKLYFLKDFDYKKHEKALDQIAEVLLDERSQGMNLDIFEQCLNKCEQGNIGDSLTPDEKATVNHKISSIKNTMQIDNLTFENLFSRYDPRGRGFISQEDFKYVLLK